MKKRRSVRRGEAEEGKEREKQIETRKKKKSK